MLGLIITGHGEFSSGLLHAAQMIAGKQEHVENVLFKDGMDLGELQAQIGDVVERHLANYGGTIILTDLKGGTPFNVSMMLTAGISQVAVLSGANLPMIIEGALLSQFAESVDDLAEQLVTVGQSGIVRAELPTSVQQDEVSDEEGI
ncbi:PTS sugar transporter subunit IIA [Aerococcaceae bacterium NML191292]|nr:PTS sugar transporter subunit IIA [Aerococcaceae bacterium NML210727]MCW6654310.1 PTS sugar transporter subunit IIA [Aerococcaceae bacterium NML201296]MCW6659574.1 PTS sugar transporter subunit IIA [Aerococcaceae bacterium NML191292]MCW6661086.1 PTS sugar transporter subunit IIA [Aerococcaceae bacterium NML201209]MCW6663524.1 PTS sugar transporter subunit IIA [Aerococcaceae bacterium NML190073]MCW6664145.1 PTS sugar transporter subunit IIA [Aerococcaceae bacterium NML191219]MCW6667525.1 PT